MDIWNDVLGGDVYSSMYNSTMSIVPVLQCSREFVTLARVLSRDIQNNSRPVVPINFPSGQDYK
jgi:hypothetical protein